MKKVAIISQQAPLNENSVTINGSNYSHVGNKMFPAWE